jgi:hypothetical protein
MFEFCNKNQGKWLRIEQATSSGLKSVVILGNHCGAPLLETAVIEDPDLKLIIITIFSFQTLLQ